MLANELAVGLFERLVTGDLDEQVARAYPGGGWAEYRSIIDDIGNDPEQIVHFERAGIILQPKQLEFAWWARRLDGVESLPDEPGAPELGFGGAKGPGKSFGLFAQAAVDDCQRFDGLKVLYLRKVGKRALEQIEDLVAAVLQRVEHRYTRGMVRFPNGSRIIIGHFNNEKEAMNYAGIEYDLILIEELTTLTERAYKALRLSARTGKRWRPRVYNSTNPLGVGHLWYRKRFIDHERKYAEVAGRSRKFIFATVEDNRFVNREYIGNLEELRGAERRAYRYGDWDISAGAYFDTWHNDVHVREPLKAEELKAWPVWASMDYGFKHWNVIQLHTRDEGGMVYTFEELTHRKRYPDDIVPELKATLGRYELSVTKLDIFLVGADTFAKTGQARYSVAEQYKKLGVALTTALTGPGSRVAGAHHLAELLGDAERDIQPRWSVTRNCKRLIETLPYLEQNPNNPEDVLKVDCDAQGNGGDDSYDCARYGLYAQFGKREARSKTYA